MSFSESLSCIKWLISIPSHKFWERRFKFGLQEVRAESESEGEGWAGPDLVCPSPAPWIGGPAKSFVHAQPSSFLRKTKAFILRSFWGLGRTGYPHWRAWLTDLYWRHYMMFCWMRTFRKKVENLDTVLRQFRIKHWDWYFFWMCGWNQQS